MKNFKVALLALFILAGFSKVNAQDSENPWMLTFGVNAVDDAISVADEPVDFLVDYIGVSDWNMIPSISRVSISRYIDKGLSVQLAGSLNRIKKIVGGNLSKESYFSIDAAAKYDINELPFVGETGWFDPFVGLGVGMNWLDDVSQLNLTPMIGANIWFSDNLGLNLQSAYKFNLGDANLGAHFQQSIGLAIRMGGTDTDGDGVFDKKDACPNVAGLPEFNGCPDTDSDGIVDADDVCPDVAGSAEFNGCPDGDGDGIADKDDNCPNAAGTKANGGCPDADSDGVLDASDACPNVAGPAENKGCPWPDTDGDGVLDKDDKCVNEVGTVANNGCAELTKEAIKKLGDFAKTINFNSGKATFKAGVEKQLDAVAEIMKEFSGAKFHIHGYTDSRGSKAKNLKLSEERAAAVKDYLISHGIDASRLDSKGFGIANPIASNKTAKGRAINRRVELVSFK